MNLWRRWPWVTAHAVLVAVLVVAVLVFALVTRDQSGDANIGLGLLALPLVALGLPWSLVYVLDPYRYDGLPDLVRFAIGAGPAVLNVFLHALLARWLRARRNRRARHTPV